MEERLKTALTDAMSREFAQVPDADDLQDSYTFSEQFHCGIQQISRLADRSYVSVGKHRIRRAVVAALIAAMLMAAAAGVAAIRRPLIQWMTQKNQADGTLDVGFHVDDPDGLTKQFTCIKPKVPQGYKIVSEEKFEDIQYSILYENEDGLEISYIQSGDIESMGLGLDNEGDALRETEIGGYKGYQYSNYGNNTLIWSNGIYLFDLSGTCSMETLREIAEKMN